MQSILTYLKRAYNLRWATVPEGVIPLTAADPDFKVFLKLPTQSLSLQRPLFLLHASRRTS
jgi:bifunctional pyridoxal-dependent enzyme with beta-cystathionase and maltose regulon repressor activities